MVELLAGALLGFTLAGHYHLDGGTGVVLAAGIAAGFYASSCWWFPRRRCWRCSGAKWRGDGRGNLRERRCLVCGGAGTLRRPGAVLLGVRHGS
ncbi:MAG TPA: hypothetical protein VM367_15400 [Pseudonocardia sp.]|jgi:hypothetical protein|nr:hypothetical protein [Pseudonocardia sp.]HWG98708.1 hypothetical protein [Pilimelia sp.]